MRYEIVSDDRTPIERRVRVRVAPESVEEVWLEEVGRLERDVMIPGFRKGKAPRRVVERHVGRESIWRTVREMVASRASGEILRDAEPKPLAPPTFDFGDEEDRSGSESEQEDVPRPLGASELESEATRGSESQREGESLLESATKQKPVSWREGEAMEFTMIYPLPPLRLASNQSTGYASYRSAFAPLA